MFQQQNRALTQHLAENQVLGTIIVTLNLQILTRNMSQLATS